LAFSRKPVQVAKFLVAGKPARNCRPVWHPASAQMARRLSPPARRSQIVLAISAL
jgi:hypothetical protein